MSLHARCDSHSKWSDWITSTYARARVRVSARRRVCGCVCVGACVCVRVCGGAETCVRVRIPAHACACVRARAHRVVRRARLVVLVDQDRDLRSRSDRSKKDYRSTLLEKG